MVSLLQLVPRCREQHTLLSLISPSDRLCHVPCAILAASSCTQMPPQTSKGPTMQKF